MIDCDHEFYIPFSKIDEWDRIKNSCDKFYAAVKWGYEQGREAAASKAEEPGPAPLSPAAQAVRRDFDQIIQELYRRCRVSISAADVLPITLETNDSSLQAGINELIAAAIHELADWVVPANGSRRNNEIREEILAIANALKAG